MALSEEEKRQLKELRRKEKEPDGPAFSKSATFNIDLSDSKAVALAKKMGLIDGDDDEDDDDKDDKDDDNDEKPKRRGYFADS